MVFTKISRETSKELDKEELEKKGNRRAVLKMFELLDSYISALKVSSDSLKDMMFEDSPNSYLVNKEFMQLGLIFKKTGNKIGEIGRYSGFTGKNEISSIIEEELKFYMEGEKLHIVFPTLLPKRYNSSSKAIYTNADIRQMYEPAFTKFFSGEKHVIYLKKAVIIYTHFFSTEKEFMDHDNFETKIITDLITANMFLDDSPKNCAIFMDYKMGEHSHTEVDVIPYDRFGEYIEKKA